MERCWPEGTVEDGVGKRVVQSESDPRNAKPPGEPMQSQTGEARRGGHNPLGAGLRAIALGDPDVESTDAHFDVIAQALRTETTWKLFTCWIRAKRSVLRQ